MLAHVSIDADGPQIDRITPVIQSISNNTNGNCVSACVATLLSVPMSVVPNFRDLRHGSALALTWLRRQGLWLRPYDVGETPMGYVIANVVSQKFPGSLHATVAHDGVVVWDPSPTASERVLPYDILHSWRIVWSGPADVADPFAD